MNPLTYLAQVKLSTLRTCALIFFLPLNISIRDVPIMHRFLQLKRTRHREYGHCHRVNAIIGTALAAELSAPNMNIGGLLRVVNKSCQRVTRCTSSQSLHAVQVYRWQRPKKTTFNGLIDCSLIYVGNQNDGMLSGVMFKSLNVKTGNTRTATFSLPTNRWI